VGVGGAEGGAPGGSGYPCASTREPCCCCCGCEPGYPCGNADDVVAAAPDVCTGVA